MNHNHVSKRPKWLKAFLLTIITVFLLFILFTSYFLYHNYVTRKTNEKNTTSKNIENTFVDLPVSSMKPKETVSHTVMVYMIGSDLETKYYYGTFDIEEMMNAKLGDDVNVVIQTGGSKAWHKSEITKGKEACQRFTINNGSLEQCKGLETVDMTSSDTLSDFVSWSMEYFPADNYTIVFWSHGCGFPSSFGADDYYPDGVLTIPEIAVAFDNAGANFDLVVFSACIMNTVEAAYALSPYSDYMIASEENMWGPFILEYTYWLTKLGNNPNISIPEVAKVMIDDYMYSLNAVNNEYGITLHGDLSLIDLSKIPKVFDRLQAFLTNAHQELLDGNLFYLVKARDITKGFAETGNGGYGVDNIDLIDFATNASLIKGSSELVSAAKEAVVYTNTNVIGTNGLAIYFPSRFLFGYDEVGYSNMLEYGFSDEYMSFFNDYASLIAYSKGLNSSPYMDIFYSEYANADFSKSLWMNAALVNSYQDIFTQHQFVIPPLVAMNETYALPITEKDQEVISSLQMAVMLEDADGLYNLGVTDFGWYYDDEDEDRFNGRNYLYDYSKSWYFFNDNIVSYNFLDTSYDEDGNQYYYGLIPAYLNGDTFVNLLVYSDYYTPAGIIIGYMPVEMTKDNLSYTGVLDLQSGNSIDFVIQTYLEDSSQWEWIEVGETYYYNGNYMWLDAYDISDWGSFYFSYIITDIYGNDHEVGWYDEATGEFREPIK